MQEIKYELATINTVKAVDVFVNGGMTPLLDCLEREAKKFVPDVETAKGRAAIKTFAQKFVKSKTFLLDMGKAEKADALAKSRSVDAITREVKERLDKLKVEVRKPLTDWENAEKARKAEVENKIDAIIALSYDRDSSGNSYGSEYLKERLVEAENTVIDESYGNRINDAALTKEQAITALKMNIANTEKAEFEKAELARLQKEEEERKQKEHDDKIRREAEAKAKREAEEAAQKEREREAEKKARIEREKAEAEAELERQKIKAEQEAKEAEQKRLDDIQAEKDRAEKEKAEAEEKRLAAIKAAEEKAEAEKQEIIRRQQEKERRERERIAAQEEEDRKRQADEDHRRAINNNILSSLLKLGASDEVAKKVIGAIAQGQVPHVEIKY